MDKVVIIAGATGGLGSEIFKALNEKRYKLAVCGRNKAMLETLTGKNDADIVLASAFDLTDNKETACFVDAVVKKFGRIDIAINCVGANTKREKVVDITVDDLKTMMDINVYSHLTLIQAVYPHIKKTKGHIVEVLSTVCLYENEGIASYSACKSAMESISKTLLKEALEDGVKVTNIYPGGINTGFRPEAREAYMSPKSVAQAAVACIELPNDVTVHELILRPPVERNF